MRDYVQRVIDTADSPAPDGAAAIALQEYVSSGQAGTVLGPESMLQMPADECSVAQSFIEAGWQEVDWFEIVQELTNTE
jgi:hypothetical protein